MTFNKKYTVFKVTWALLLVGTICDYNISDSFGFGSFSAKLQLSSAVILTYLLSFLIIVPFREFSHLFRNKYDRMNIVILGLLLIVAYISSYFSLMQKYALVNTTSRYFLFFLVLIATIVYSKYFADSVKFIYTSFIYANFIVIVSCLADYLFPDFNRLLIQSFGHMGLRDSIMKIGGVIYMRPSGFVSDTNLTGFSIALSFFLLLLNHRNFNKYLIYVFSIFSGLCFGMLASRSALITISAFIILSIVFKYMKWKNVLVFILIFYSVQFLTPQTQARVLQIFDKEMKTEELEHGRPLIWKAGVIALGVKPSLGIGSGVFFMQSDVFIAKAKELIDENDFSREIMDPMHVPLSGINPHNIFLTMLIEHGYAGLLLFTILLLHILYKTIKQKKYISLIMMLGLLFVSLLSNYSPYYKYFLLMVVIYYVYADKRLTVDDGIQKSK